MNLGIELAREGKCVMLIDVDAQGSLSASLGYQKPDQIEVTLVTVMANIINDSPLPHGMGIIHHEESVDLLPANIELSGMEITLVNTMSRETILWDYLKTVCNDYDVVILDCCPSLSMLTINTLAAADKVLIPVQAQYLSIKGLEQLMLTIAKAWRQINLCLSIGGILVTMADMRTNYTRDIIELLHSTYDGNPVDKVAEAYAALTREVLT